MENLNTALLLMVVGMTTVFAILLIVIYLGKGLILLVNKYAPEEVVPDKKGAQVCRNSRKHFGCYQCRCNSGDTRQG